MLIILEGVDATGKSRLAEKLMERLDHVTYEHHGPPKAHPLVEYEKNLVDSYSPGSGQNFVLDRHFLGESVWPTIFTRNTELTFPARRHINLALRSLGAFLVFCDDESEKIHRRIADRGEERLPPGQVDLARFLFRLALVTSTLPYLPYVLSRAETDLTYVDRTVDAILDSAHREERKAAVPLGITPAYLGSSLPTLLLVGDEGNKSLERPAIPRPFVPWPETSGAFLLHQLSPTYNLGIVNSQRDGREEPLRSLWTALNEPRVVALGNHAHERLARQEVPHGRVPHPQFVRRFYHLQGPRYARAIEVAGIDNEDLRDWFPPHPRADKIPS